MKFNLETLTILFVKLVQFKLRIFLLLPKRIALFFIYFTAKVIYLIIRTTSLPKEVAQNILSILKPAHKLGDSEFYQAKKLLKNLCFSIIEIICLPYLKKTHLDSIIKIKGTENIDRALAKKKGIILISLHTSNSESVQMGLRNLGYKINMVTKDPPQNKIFQFLRKCRSAKGTRLINVETENMYKEGLKVLKNNEILGLAIDTGAAEANHVFIKFLKHNAPIATGWATLAERSEAEILPVITRRINGINHVSIKEPIPSPITEEDYQKLAPLFENYIKEDPSNWAFFVNTREVHRLLGIHHIKHVLVLSNGHGEDAIGAKLIQTLQEKDPSIIFSALPIVGEGKSYLDLGIRLLGPRKKMPSGGFIYMNIFTTLKDVFSGVVGNTLEQINILRKQQKKLTLVIAIGDSVPIRAALITRAPFIFIGSAESAYYDKSYPAWERRLLKKALAVFPRDLKTYASLKDSGLKVEFAGNALMDCILVTSHESRVAGQRPWTRDTRHATIGFLPGTREDTRLNIEDFEIIAEEIEKLTIHYSLSSIRYIIATNEENIPLKFERKSFAEVISESDIIIGLSGTGNEQAAGFGIPLVAFVGRGTQYTKRFASEQKKLIGDALSLVESKPKIVANEVLSILTNPERYKQMQAIGKERMGEQGAIEKIAKRVLELT